MLLYGNIEVDDIIYDSRKAKTGTIFVCMRGAVTDGHKYAAEAYDKGCRVFLCEEQLALPPDSGVIQIINSDTRLELAKISAQFFGYPAKKLKIIGVTGTKGKTSVAAYIFNILNRSGIKAGFIGTTGIIIGEKRISTVNSTPESYELHKTFADMVNNDIEYAVMEVSSQAYKLNRVYGLEFEIGIYTNLSPDHISAGEHENFEEYKYYKTQLFKNSKRVIFNADDKYGREMASNAKYLIKSYAVNNQADFMGSDIALWRNDNILGVQYKYNGEEVYVKTPGIFSVYNSLAAISACETLGIGINNILRALKNISVKGRFEIVQALPRVVFIIDYAHNELSMRAALETIREYRPKRLICLFGSVGGKAKSRRFGLGQAAGELSDFCIITSDNPDYEDPLDIISEIELGVKSNIKNCAYIVIADREKAVEYAVLNAAEGDVILFAGKGHEDYQIIKGEYVPFSETEIIKRTCESILLSSCQTYI